MSRIKLSKNEVGKPNDVWVIQHGEIYAVELAGRIGYVHDHVVFHIASSLKEVKGFLKQCLVASYSWWVVTNYPVNDLEYDEPHVLYFNNKGKQLKLPPITTAIKAYKKERRKDKFLQPVALHD